MTIITKASQHLFSPSWSIRPSHRLEVLIISHSRISVSSFSTSFIRGAPKAFPSYTIWGHTAALVLKPLPPQFKIAQPSGGLVLAQKGKIALELVPKSNTTSNTYQQHAWKQAIRYMLSPEDVGVILNALPSQEVELSTRVSMNDDDISMDYNNQSVSASSTSSSYPSMTNQDSIIERVLKLSPAPSGAAIQVSIDFIKDGIGGVLLPHHLQKYGTPAGNIHPLQVDMQTGEWILVKSLLEYSIPYLLGWSDMVPLNNQNSIMEAQNHPSSATRNTATNYSNNFFGNEGVVGRGYTNDLPTSNFYEKNYKDFPSSNKRYSKRNTSKISTSDNDDPFST